jgi:hypothetical protein
MKELKEQPFVDRQGNQVLFPVTDPVTGLQQIFEPKLSWVLRLIVEAYTPKEDFILNNADIRKQWVVLDTLARGKEFGDVFSFEDEEFMVLYRIVSYFGPQMVLKNIFNNSPLLEDILVRILSMVPEVEPAQ